MPFFHILSATISSHEISVNLNSWYHWVSARSTSLHTLSMSLGRQSGGNRVLHIGYFLFTSGILASKVPSEGLVFIGFGEVGASRILLLKLVPLQPNLNSLSIGSVSSPPSMPTSPLNQLLYFFAHTVDSPPHPLLTLTDCHHC